MVLSPPGARPSPAAALPRRSGGLPLLTRAAAATARAAGAASRLAGAGGGTTLPGRVLLRVVPDGIAQLRAGRRYALVSGTNGKTTTTRFLSVALESLGPVLSNSDGSNLRAGLASALLRDRHAQVPRAVLEVDEAALPRAVTELQPQLLVLLNLSRDQLDRFGEVAGHVPRWAAAIAGAPATRVVANADDPLVAAAVLTARPGGDAVTWVAAGQPWRSDSSLCPRCRQAWPVLPSGWSCPRCGLSRPPADWQLDGTALVGPGGERWPLLLRLPGRANRADAVLAAVAAREFGVPVPVALERIAGVVGVAGRYELRTYGGCTVRLLLAKNPAGWLEVLQQVGSDRTPLVLGVNARGADGADPSWIWDVPFERLRGRRVVASGERAADLSVRLAYAGVEHETVPDPLAAVARLAAPSCDLVGNYTVFARARSALR